MNTNNSKFDKQIEQFIELRINGYTFAEIATQLNTSKQTLIEWNKTEIVRNTIQAKHLKYSN